MMYGYASCPARREGTNASVLIKHGITMVNKCTVHMHGKCESVGIAESRLVTRAPLER